MTTKTIADLFQLTGFTPTQEQLAGIDELADAVASSHSGMWTRFLQQQAARLPELLDIDLAHLVGRAVCTHQELREYADPDKHAPDETIAVAIVDREITSTHKPAIEFYVNHIKQGTLEFQVTLKLAVSSLELLIRAGRIKALRLGSCQGSGEISIAGVPIVERNTSPIEIGPEIDLGDGIAIAA